MQFFATVAAAATLFASVASAYNGFYKPEDGEKIPAGAPYLIKWVNDLQDSVQINLKKGPSTMLEDKGMIVMLEYNYGNYTWHVPADLPAGKDYAFQITWGKTPSATDINYTGLFEITNGDDTTHTDDSSSTSTTAATEESSATETSTSGPVETPETPTYTNGTATTTTTTSGSTPSGTSHSNTSVTVTKSTATSSSTAPAKDDNSGANVIGASAGVAAMVALAAAVLL